MKNSDKALNGDGVGVGAPGCREEVVHGQRLHFCTPDALERALTAERFGVVAISKTYLRLLPSWIALMRRYPELRIGIHYFPVPQARNGGRLMYYGLIDLGGATPQRVEVLSTRCETCGWRGYRGTPLVYDIYFGIGEGYDKWELMRASDQYPEVGCPRCRSALPQRPVWVGELPGEDV